MKHHTLTQLSGILLTLALSVCAMAAPPQPSAQDLVKVKPEWLTRALPCNVRDIIPEDYQACLKVLVSRMEPLDPKRREHFGEFYDPSNYYECRKGRPANESTCEYLALRRQGNPEYWPYPNVPPIKWPDPPKEPTYKPGMTSEQYFRALCEKEAGEFIDRTVERVQGIYEIRPRTEPWANQVMHDRYILEDPWGFVAGSWYVGGETPAKLGEMFVQPTVGKYRFAETPNRSESPQSRYYIRLYRDDNAHPGRTIQAWQDGRSQFVPYVVASLRVEGITARYGFIWRGISRLRDREHAIAGGELAIVDLSTNEILGLRRDFVIAAKSRHSPSGITWEGGRPCNGTRSELSQQFIWKVLRP